MNMTKLILTHTLALTLGLLPISPAPAAIKEIVEGYTQLSKDLTSLASELPANQNYLVSAKNISDLLALLALGSGEATTTREELATTLGFRPQELGLGLSEISQLNQDLTQITGPTHEWEPTPTKLNLATSLWANSATGFRFQKSYMKRATHFLDAEVKGLDFRAQTALAEINSWVEQKTEGMIPKLLTSLPGDAPSVLVSTLFIEGAWMNKFDEKLTKEQDFHLLNGKSKKLNLMVQTKHLDYEESELGGVGFQFVSLPTSDQKARMEIYLPESLNVSEQFRQAFLETADTRPSTNTEPNNPKGVRLYLPKFKVNYKDQEMKETLSALLPNAFGSQADYSLIGNAPLVVGKVIHETVLEIQENGFRAAAATGAIMRETAIRPIENPVVMRVDRPFAIRIVAPHKGMDVELFKGWIADPEIFK